MLKFLQRNKQTSQKLFAPYLSMRGHKKLKLDFYEFLFLFPIQNSIVFTCQLYKSFQNTVGIGEIARNNNFGKLSVICMKIRTVLCKFFHYGRVQNLSGKGLSSRGDHCQLIAILAPESVTGQAKKTESFLPSILSLNPHYFLNLKVTQFLIGLTIWFCKSEVVLF